jgi:hypothetical protein
MDRPASASRAGGIPGGPGEHVLDLAGDWVTAWQSFKDGEEVIALQPVRVTQDGAQLQIETLERGRSVEDGGYHWRGQLRLWDNELLMGWYASVDTSVRSKGTMYFVVHPQGRRMAGRWVGLSYDGKIVTGNGAMSRDESEARDVIARLQSNGTDTPPDDTGLVVRLVGVVVGCAPEGWCE